MLLVQVMAWCCLSNKILPKPLMTQPSWIHWEFHSMKRYILFFTCFLFHQIESNTNLLSKPIMTYHHKSSGSRNLQKGFIGGLVQERCDSIANALEFRLPCINPSICCWCLMLFVFTDINISKLHTTTYLITIRLPSPFVITVQLTIPSMICGLFLSVLMVPPPLPSQLANYCLPQHCPHKTTLIG